MLGKRGTWVQCQPPAETCMSVTPADRRKLDFKPEHGRRLNYWKSAGRLYARTEDWHGGRVIWFVRQE